MDGSRMPPKGSKVRGGPAHLGDGVVHVVGEDLHDAGPPARRGGAEVGQPAVVGLDAGPAPLVVLGRRGQRDQVPLGEEGGDRVGEEHLGRDAVGLGLGQAPVAVPAAVGDRREEVGEGVDVLGRPGVELVVPAAGQIGPVVLDVAAGVAVGRDDRVARRAPARSPSSAQRRRGELARRRWRRPGGAAWPPPPRARTR